MKRGTEIAAAMVLRALGGMALIAAVMMLAAAFVLSLGGGK